ncbi:hypothetical protein RFI_29685, partial [Reticulomyxa filosa]
YSAYLVIERVVVRSNQSKSNENERHVWKSGASGTYRVRDDSDNPYLIKRGTEIYLYLKDDCANFCKEKTIKEIIKKHSQFVFRINLLTIKEEEKQKKKTHKLLFVPKKAPFEPTRKENNIKLFVPRVFIMDDCNDLCTKYLSLIRCVADIEGLTLKFSMESLQQNKILKVIQKNVLKKCLELFGEIAENKANCKVLYEQHKNINLGVNEDSKNHNKLADLLKYHSTKYSGELRSLKEHVSIIKENQKHLYYTTGESRANVEASTFLEALKKIYFEVLFLVDPIDEFAVQQLRECDRKKFICVIKECFDLPLTEEEKKQEDEKVAYELLTKKIKEIMWYNVEKVICQIVDSSCSLAKVEYGWSKDMKKIMKDLLISGLSL